MRTTRYNQISVIFERRLMANPQRRWCMREVPKKLQIRRETIRELNPVELAQVWAGRPPKTDVSNNCCDPTDPTITCQPTG